MAIVKCSEILDMDRRWKQWGKVVDVDTVDLDQSNGYSLGGRWVRWNEAAALNADEFLVVASEQGSRARKEYYYALIRGGDTATLLHTDDGDCHMAGEDEEAYRDLRKRALAAAPEDQQAKASNSQLYEYALIIAHLSADAGVGADTEADAGPLSGVSTEDLLAELRRRGALEG